MRESRARGRTARTALDAAGAWMMRGASGIWLRAGSRLGLCCHGTVYLLVGYPAFRLVLLAPYALTQLLEAVYRPARAAGPMGGWRQRGARDAAERAQAAGGHGQAGVLSSADQAKGLDAIFRSGRASPSQVRGHLLGLRPFHHGLGDCGQHAVRAEQFKPSPPRRGPAAGRRKAQR